MTYIHDKTGSTEIAMHAMAQTRLDRARDAENRLGYLASQDELDAQRVPYGDDCAGCDPQMWQRFHEGNKKAARLETIAGALLLAVIIGALAAWGQATYGAYIAPGAW